MVKPHTAMHRNCFGFVFSACDTLTVRPTKNNKSHEWTYRIFVFQLFETTGEISQPNYQKTRQKTKDKRQRTTSRATPRNVNHLLTTRIREDWRHHTYLQDDAYDYEITGYHPHAYRAKPQAWYRTARTLSASNSKQAVRTQKTVRQ